MAWSQSPFATFLILCPTSFFLGILFSLFPYDYPLLWTSLPPTALSFSTLESHLKHLHSSPPIIPRLLHITISLGLLGFILKLYRPSESNLLFDGASLVLYVIAIVIYISNIVRGLRQVSEGEWGPEGALGPGEVLGEGERVVGREDGLRVMSATNTILALVLVGVLVLQAGQWYAERKEGQEVLEMERREKEKEKERGKRSPGLKKKN